MRLRCDVSALTEPDIGTVEALARWQLQARRNGVELCLCHCPARLQRLLDLAGLAEVLPVCPLSVQPVGQAEQREDPGRVEEEADPGDGTV